MDTTEALQRLRRLLLVSILLKTEDKCEQLRGRSALRMMTHNAAVPSRQFGSNSASSGSHRLQSCNLLEKLADLVPIGNQDSRQFLRPISSSDSAACAAVLSPPVLPPFPLLLSPEMGLFTPIGRVSG